MDNDWRCWEYTKKNQSCGITYTGYIGKPEGKREHAMLLPEGNIDPPWRMKKWQLERCVPFECVTILQWWWAAAKLCSDGSLKMRVSETGVSGFWGVVVHVLLEGLYCDDKFESDDAQQHSACFYLSLLIQCTDLNSLSLRAPCIYFD